MFAVNGLRWFVLCFLALVLPFRAAFAEGSASTSRVERFKVFLASPPVVQELVFREKLAADPNRQVQYDGSFAKSTNFAIFKAAWQKGALLFFQTTNENVRTDYSPSRLFISIFNGEHWLSVPGRYVETCTAPFGTFDNPVTMGIAFNILTLNQVLQGGVMHVRPGDIEWSGDHFVVKNVPSPYMRPLSVEGRLLESNDFSTGMLVRYSTGNNSTDINAEWRIVYYYDRKLDAEFFPSDIKAYWERGGTEVEMDEFEILKLKLGTQPLPRARFDPKLLLGGFGPPIRIFTNNAMYQTLPDGGLEKVYVISKSKVMTDLVTWFGPRLGFWLLCCMNLLFLALLLKTRKRSETQTQQQ